MNALRIQMSCLLLWSGIIFSATCLTIPGQAESPPSVTKLLEYEQFALTHAGDPERGKAIYADQQRTKCAVCHKVNDQGGEVGPVLNSIGGKFDRPHLIESLLEPSRQIVEGFRSATLLTEDGQVLTGVIKQETQEQITLLDATGKRHDIEVSKVQRRDTSSVSIMPQGLADTLSRQEFADVISYLETLRSGEQKMGAGVSGPIKLAAGFEVRTIATSLTGGVALETTRDGRIFVCEQTGALRVIRDGRLLDEPFAVLPVQVEWERGLIGVTVHPDFPRVPYVYVCYVAKEPTVHHVISRLTADGDKAVPGSEKILIEGDDQSKLGGTVPAGHQGGALHFGPDGKLYIAIGEQTAGFPSQDLGTFQGKMLRLDADGSIPKDNPFVSEAIGKYQAIWARGLRNPFTFAFQPSSGDMLINDVGGIFEEINRGQPGANYGWPVVEHGPTDDLRFVGPIHIYPQASISGGDFIPHDSNWPAALRGRYLFADFVHGWMHTIDPASSSEATTFAEGLRRPVDMRFGSDGNLYVLLRNAWVIDGKFEGQTGSLLSIRYRGEGP